MDDDAQQEPVTSGSDKKRADDEHESARAATAEFRIPENVSLTRPDISIRRPATDEAAPESASDDDASEEPAPTPSQGPWYVPLPKPTGEAEEPEEDEKAAAPEAVPAETPAKPESGSAGPTRVEALPVLPPPSQSAPPHSPPAQSAPSQSAPAQFPAVRSSGQWTVPWDGPAPASPAPPALPGPPAPPLEAVAETGAEPKRGRHWLVVVAAALVLVAGIVVGQLARPVPEPSVELALASSHAFPGQAPALPWPSAGQSVVHVDGLGTMGTSGGATPIPTASVAKVMTAYVYLRDHPLKPGEAGPVMTVSPEAAAQIPGRKQRGESILGVTANQQLTQRKALEALMIISANDVAHELARWDAGNAQAFVAKMNAAAASLGMTGTRYTDPSGYHSGTVSTAADQVKLLRAAMNVPAFAEIVNTRAYVPDDGGETREGGNFLLGQFGVVGGKTGYTDAAGGNFVFAARKNVAGVNTLIVGAVMGQKSPTAAGAVNTAGQLVTAAEAALTVATLAPKGARVGRIDDGLGDTTPLRAASPVTVVGWAGLTVPIRVQGDPPREGGPGERVATVTAGAARVPLELGRTLNEPSIVKRLIRLG
ncbi:D-alanyl-D-alanine carboxypeptidase family protein [Actinomadura soli]|uniref:D-alanyl-D-alanine carboxypeptidase family protein n=1 Tax=Actinomadura soli TaxID=2508997 RepID=UPI001E455A4A|nr:D-alanyl-D-alanine carboxypeptidase [Actinomadura soli]